MADWANSNSPDGFWTTAMMYSDTPEGWPTRTTPVVFARATPPRSPGALGRRRAGDAGSRKVPHTG